MYLRYGDLPWDDASSNETANTNGAATVTAAAAASAALLNSVAAGKKAKAGERLRIASRDLRHERLPVVMLNDVAIHAVTEAGAVRYIIDELEAGRGGTVVTPNLDHLRRCEHDMSFCALVAESDLVVPDGMPLVWASRIQGEPLPERVAGSDLISSLSAAAADKGRSIYLLGGDEGTAEAAAKVLMQRHPHLKIAGTCCPPFGFDKKDEQIRKIVDELRATQPDIVFVALGSPKQEMLVERIRKVLPRAWWLGVGNSFSFLSGQVRRAPVWMQKRGIEWLHRLLQEPKKLFKRYIVFGVPFAFKLLSRSAMKGLPKRLRKSELSTAGDVAEAQTVETPEAIDSDKPIAPAPPVAPNRIAEAAASTTDRPLVGSERETLRKLRAVVLLAGAVRPMPITAATGRSILDLPVDNETSILGQWIEHTAALARVAGLESLPIRAMVNRHSPDPLGAVTSPNVVRVERDFGEYRGTGGVLRDLCARYDDDDVVLVANGGQVLLEPLADIAVELARMGGEVALVSHADGTPSGIMLVTCKALRLISEAGYVDMKEQALPQIAARYEVSVLQRRRPTGLPVRSLTDYISALRTLHRRRSGRPAMTDPLAEDWRPTFSVVEQGAAVDPMASLNDSVVLRGGRMEAGAVAVRSVVCPRGMVRKDSPAVDQFVNAASEAAAAAAVEEDLGKAGSSSGSSSRGNRT